MEAQQRIRRIVEGRGTLSYTRHARERGEERGIDLTDCKNVLQGGFVDGSFTTFEAGTWRYRVCTPRMAVVVAFSSEDRLVVITMMRRDQ